MLQCTSCRRRRRRRRRRWTRAHSEARVHQRCCNAPSRRRTRRRRRMMRVRFRVNPGCIHDAASLCFLIRLLFLLLLLFLRLPVSSTSSYSSCSFSSFFLLLLFILLRSDSGLSPNLTRAAFDPSSSWSSSSSSACASSWRSCFTYNGSCISVAGCSLVRWWVDYENKCFA